MSIKPPNWQGVLLGLLLAGLAALTVALALVKPGTVHGQNSPYGQSFPTTGDSLPERMCADMGLSKARVWGRIDAAGVEHIDLHCWNPPIEQSKKGYRPPSKELVERTCNNYAPGSVPAYHPKLFESEGLFWCVDPRSLGGR